MKRVLARRQTVTPLPLRDGRLLLADGRGEGSGATHGVDQVGNGRDSWRRHLHADRNNTKCHSLTTDNNALAAQPLEMHDGMMFDGGSNRDDVAARIRLLRRAYGFENQTAFALQSGISQSEINHFESGRRPLPLSAASKLKLRWRVTLDWIYYGDRSGLTVEVDRLLPTLEQFRQTG